MKIQVLIHVLLLMNKKEVNIKHSNDEIDIDICELDTKLII